MSRKPHIYELPCHCTHDGNRWIELCAQHRLSEDEIHARALADHQAREWSRAMALEDEQQGSDPDPAPQHVLTSVNSEPTIPLEKA